MCWRDPRGGSLCLADIVLSYSQMYETHGAQHRGKEIQTHKVKTNEG